MCYYTGRGYAILKTIYFHKEDIHFDSKHLIWFAHILYVILNVKVSKAEVGINSKRLPLGGGSLERRPD